MSAISASHPRTAAAAAEEEEGDDRAVSASSRRSSDARARISWSSSPPANFDLAAASLAHRESLAADGGVVDRGGPSATVGSPPAPRVASVYRLTASSPSLCRGGDSIAGGGCPSSPNEEEEEEDPGEEEDEDDDFDWDWSARELPPTPDKSSERDMRSADDEDDDDDDIDADADGATRRDRDDVIGWVKPPTDATVVRAARPNEAADLRTIILLWVCFIFKGGRR